MTKTGNRPVLQYFIITYLISWTFWITNWLLGKFMVANSTINIIRTLLMIAGSFGPGIAAVIMVSKESNFLSVKDFLKKGLIYRFSWKWYGISILLPFIIVALSLIINSWLGGKNPDINEVDFLRIPFIFICVLVVGGPLGEEFGWRGYALTRLLNDYSSLTAGLIVGLGWVFWHLPLFYIKGMPQYGWPFWLYFIYVMGLSIIFTWIYVNTEESILLVILLHTSINTPALIVNIIPNGVTYRPFLVLVVFLILLDLIIIRTKGIDLGRRGNNYSVFG